MIESLFKPLFSLVRYIMTLEGTTAAGRVNILGMLLSLILAISLSLAPIFETLIRLVHPNIEIGAPLLPVFVAFCLFTIACASMIGYLDGSYRSRTGQPEGKSSEASEDTAPKS